MRTRLSFVISILILSAYGCSAQKKLPGLFGIQFGQSVGKQNQNNKIKIINFDVGYKIEPPNPCPELNSYVVFCPKNDNATTIGDTSRHMISAMFGSSNNEIATIRAAGRFGTKEEARRKEKTVISWLEQHVSGIKFQQIPIVKDGYVAYYRSNQSKLEQIVVVKICVDNEVVVLANDMSIDGLGLVNMLNTKEMDVSLHGEMFMQKSSPPLPQTPTTQTCVRKDTNSAELCGIILGESITGDLDFTNRATVIKTAANSWFEPERVYYINPVEHFIDPLNSCAVCVSLQDNKVSEVQCVRKYSSRNLDKIRSDYHDISIAITNSFNCLTKHRENKISFWSDKWELGNGQEIILAFNGFNNKDEGTITITLIDVERRKQNWQKAKKKGISEF